MRTAEEKYYKKIDKFLKDFKIWATKNIGKKPCEDFVWSCIICQTWLIIALLEGWVDERYLDEEWGKK